MLTYKKITRTLKSLFLLCAVSTVSLNAAVEENFDFSVNTNGWTGEFAEYPVGGEYFFELAWGWTNLPKVLHRKCESLTKGLFLTGNNHSDNLFMFVKRPISGLKPSTEYNLTFHVTIENDVYPGQVGIGGSPGEGVYFKVGGSKKEPNKVDVNGFYVMNVDIGSQSQGGKNAIVVGDLANPLVDPLNPQFEPKQFTNETPLKVKTDKHGQLWVFVGTDSGFEGTTLYYIVSIDVKLREVTKCK
jgi:hypothetical protein